MLDPFQSRQASGVLVAAVAAVVLSSGMAPTMPLADRAPDAESAVAASSQDAQAAGSVSPLIDYLNAVGAATAAAEP